MKKDNDKIKSCKLIELGFIHTETDGNIYGYQLGEAHEWCSMFVRLVMKPHERVHSVFVDNNHIPYVRTMRDITDLMRMWMDIEMSA